MSDTFAYGEPRKRWIRYENGSYEPVDADGDLRKKPRDDRRIEWWVEDKKPDWRPDAYASTKRGQKARRELGTAQQQQQAAQPQGMFAEGTGQSKSSEAGSLPGWGGQSTPVGSDLPKQGGLTGQLNKAGGAKGTGSLLSASLEELNGILAGVDAKRSKATNAGQPRTNTDFLAAKKAVSAPAAPTVKPLTTVARSDGQQPNNDLQPQDRLTGKASARLGGPEDGKVTLLDDSLQPILSTGNAGSQVLHGGTGKDEIGSENRNLLAVNDMPGYESDRTGTKGANEYLSSPKNVEAKNERPAVESPNDLDLQKQGTKQNPSEMTLNEEGVQFIQDAEGFGAKPYEDSAGHCTIGFGQLLHKGACTQEDFDAYQNGLTDKDAKDLFNSKIDKYQDAVRKHVKVPLTQTQYNALVSFVYNFGETKFKNSTLLKKLNEGKLDEVPSELRRWINETTSQGKVKSQGLVNRREKEIQLFMRGQK